VVGLLSQGLPCPFYPVPFPVLPCGRFLSRLPSQPAGRFATYSCGIRRIQTFWECRPPFGCPLSPFNCQRATKDLVFPDICNYVTRFIDEER
jgi:hypothetical protein